MWSTTAHRLLLLLGLAVGGWLVSVLVAGAATAEESHDPAPDSPGCSHEAGATQTARPQANPDSAECEAQAAPQDTPRSGDGNGGAGKDTDPGAPTDGTDSTDGTAPTDESRPADETEPTRPGTVDENGTVDETEPTDKGRPTDETGTVNENGSADETEPTDKGRPTDETDTVNENGSADETEPARPDTGLASGGTDDTGDGADRPSDGSPEEVDLALLGAPSPEVVRVPVLLEPVRPLLGTTTGTLLSTTRNLASTTGSLTDLLSKALPGATGPVRDTLDDVVDAPSTLPAVEAPLHVLPGITLPRLPIGVQPPDPVSPGEPSDRPGGEARIEPVAAPKKAPEPPPTAPPRHAAPEADRVTEAVDSSRWTVPESEEGTEARSGRSSRPLGPVAPSPAAPASVTAPSNVAASPQDSSQHAHRGEHGILGDLPTVTQLRLLGSSRDPGAVGVGREAALPTTSPD